MGGKKEKKEWREREGESDYDGEINSISRMYIHNNICFCLSGRDREKWRTEKE